MNNTDDRFAMTGSGQTPKGKVQTNRVDFPCCFFACNLQVIVALLGLQTYVEDLNFTVLGNMYGALMYYDGPLLLKLFGKAMLCEQRKTNTNACF